MRNPLEEKGRVNVYLDKKLVSIARMEVDNLSELFNDFLTSYLSATSVESIDRKINEQHNKIKALEAKRQDLLDGGVSEEKQNDINKNILQQLRDTYTKRRNQVGDNFPSDELWITSPKNLQKCKMLNKEPYSMLHDLRKWYGEHKNLDVL